MMFYKYRNKSKYISTIQLVHSDLFASIIESWCNSTHRTHPHRQYRNNPSPSDNIDMFNSNKHYACIYNRDLLWKISANKKCVRLSDIHAFLTSKWFQHREKKIAKFYAPSERWWCSLCASFLCAVIILLLSCMRLQRQQLTRAAIHVDMCCASVCREKKYSEWHKKKKKIIIRDQFAIRFYM